MKKKYYIIQFLLDFFLITSIVLESVRIFSPRKLLNTQYSESVSFSFAPRNEENDSWTTQIPALSSLKPGRSILHGQIFKGTVENNIARNLDEWSVQINIAKSCYLNCSWNGTTEIHTFRAGKELIQKPIDLRTYDPALMTVDIFPNSTGLLLIPLEPGDYIIYHPNTSTPIENFLPAKIYNYAPSVSFGLIFYSLDSFDFSDVLLTYRHQYGFLDDPYFYVLAIIITALSILTFTINRIHVIRTNNHNDKIKTQKTVDEIMQIFTRFIDAKDAYTGGHSERVARYSKLLAIELGKKPDECQTIYYCGLLHDCGKIAIPDDILHKPEKLSEEEYKTIQSHTIRGYLLLSDLSSIPEACDAARYHHESYDGTGYPYKLKGKDIPEYARIICMADSFDTMNSDRSYREALPKEVILEEVMKCSGVQFDPEIVEAFFRLVEKGLVGFKNKGNSNSDSSI